MIQGPQLCISYKNFSFYVDACYNYMYYRAYDSWDLGFLFLFVTGSN